MSIRQTKQSPWFIPRSINPTEEQLDIQTATNKIILIEANAGAAKTTTLALRIAESLARNVPAEKILALVFTPEAALALKNCLFLIGVNEKDIASMSIETFEMFSKRMLELIEGQQVPYLSTSEILKPRVIQAMEKVFEKFAHQYPLDEISLNMNNIAVDEFLNLQLRIKAKMEFHTANTEDLSVEEIAETILGVTPTLYLLFQEYERSRTMDGEMAGFRGKFDNIYDLVRLLEDYPDYINILPEFRSVLADELHDLSEATFRLLSIILNRENTFFCGAGDKDQVIYSWAGADHQFLQQRFKQSFPALLPLPLTKTFRHGPHLAESMSIFKQKSNKSGVVMRTQLDVMEYGGNTGHSCVDRIVGAIQQWKKENGYLGSVVILIRSQYQSIEIENALFQADIGYKPFRMESYLQRQEILLMRGVLSIALGNLDSIEDPFIRKRIVDALITFAEIVFDRNPKKNYFEAKKAQEDVAEYPELISSFFLNHIQRNSGNGLVKDTMVSAMKYLEQSPPDAPVGIALQVVFEILKLEAVVKRIFVSRVDAADVSKSILGFIQASRDSGMNLKDFSNWLNETEKTLFMKKWQDTVTLCLIDNAKGFEFDHVIIPYLSADEFPKSGYGKLEEENRFYVAATRAKRKLTLIVPEDNNQRSRFVGEMQIGKSVKEGNRLLAEMIEQAPNVSPEITYLNAGFGEHLSVKALGARFDPAKKKWYVLPGRDLQPFQQWID